MARMSETGTRRATGFTLVEILAVVAIAGIVLALAAVNLFPGDAEVARREASSLALAVEGARDEAWFGGRPTAVAFSAGRFHQWRLAASGQWEAQESRERALGEARVAALHVEGVALAPESRLVFLPDGFGVPFRIAVEVRGLARAIEGDAAGAVRVVER